MYVLCGNDSLCFVHQVEAVTRKMEENQMESDTRLEEHARLLDIRAGRIRVSNNSQLLEHAVSFLDYFCCQRSTRNITQLFFELTEVRTFMRLKSFILILSSIL